MNQFATPRVFQAKPSNLKKKLALAAFAVGAIAFTLSLNLAKRLGCVRFTAAFQPASRSAGKTGDGWKS